MAELPESSSLKSGDYTHFVAIDFGTAGTGCAYSTFVKVNQPEIRTYERWPGLIPGTCKTPTVLLLDPDEKFKAFGKEALDTYYSLNRSEPKSVGDYYLFRQFKMTLYSLQGISRDLKIQASNGKSLPAVTVFTLSLEYLRNTIIEWLDKDFKHPKRRFLWILTVPAIWSHGAKCIMRLAAEKVFLNDEKYVQENPHNAIILALEPEAAALHCMLQNELLQVTKHYLIVDCGGGTIDIVAHKMTKDENGKISIEELIPPHGSSSGGFQINCELEKLFCELCNLSVQDMDEIKTKYAKEWNKIIDEFELSKTYVNPNSNHFFDTDIAIGDKIYDNIKQKSGKTIRQLVEMYKNHKLGCADDEKTLLLPYATMYSLFQPVISRISVVIKTVLQKPECSKVNEIVLVGGFATNHLLYQEILSLFPTMNITQNKDAFTAVLKGAVKYGMNHKIITSRKIPLSIGMETCVPFVEGIHDEQLKIRINGKDYCKGIFLKCIEINESIKQNTVFEQEFQLLENVSSCRFAIYGSQSGSVKYVASKECYPIAQFEISDFKHLQENRKIKIALSLGGTEMKVSACSATCDDIKLLVKSVDAFHGNTLGIAETVNIDVRSLYI